MIVSQLWRYPVASVGGYTVDRFLVVETDVPGDREYFLVDLMNGEVAAPERSARWRPALQLRAFHENENLLVASDHWRMASDDVRMDDALSDHFGFHCGLRRRGTSIVTQGGAVGVRPRYDASPLHIVSAEELNSLMAVLPDASVDVRRFRPNVVVDGVGLDRIAIGSQHALGSLTATITERTKRCGMTMIAQRGLAENAEILRTIVRTRSRCFGVYAAVSASGMVAVGDALVPT